MTALRRIGRDWLAEGHVRFPCTRVHTWNLFGQRRLGTHLAGGLLVRVLRHTCAARMAYSRFTNRMRRLFWAHVEADARGMPVDEVLGAHQERAKTPARFVQETLSRRAFLRRLGVMGTAAAMGYALQPGPRFGRGRGGNVRVVIIGAGLAGLQCAHQLAQHGVQATIYEAADRIGGRVLSDTITFDGIVAEHGGAFISTEHTATRYLAQTLGLDLEVIHGGALLQGEELYLIDGDFYTLAEANQDWSVAWKAFQTELQAAPFPQTFEAFTQRGLELDQIAIPEWFDPTSPFSNPILSTFGPDSRFAQLCYSDAIAEYGGDHTVQPALNLLYLLAWNPRNSITSLPGTDEQYRIVGGDRAARPADGGEPAGSHPGREGAGSDCGECGGAVHLSLCRRLNGSDGQAGLGIAVSHAA
jgi:monoamine oxidase